MAHEISPYLELTEFAALVNKLIIKANTSGFEIRCIMPRFKSINERRHKLHEVLRLTGINIRLSPEEYPLQIKVASLGNARVQIYFLENEDLFHHENLFHDDNDKFDTNNGLRSLFFCKGVIETLKKFAWPPDIIHCSGWLCGFLPLLIKRTYKKEPVFIPTKVIYTICQDFFKEKLEPQTLEILKKEFAIDKKDIEIFQPLTNDALHQGALHFADAVMVEHGAEKKWETLLAKPKSKKHFIHTPDTESAAVMDFYNLISK